MGNLLQDFRYSFRGLVKSPGFAIVALLVLALGIGANTAIFSVVNAVLLRPLPYPDADRLVRIWHVPPPASFPGMTTFSVSAANYIDWEKENHVFQNMSIFSFRTFDLTGTDHPEQLAAAAVSSQFFSVLGIQPILGRTFTPDEDQQGHGNVVILSHRLWQSHFGSNPDIVGQDIHLNGQTYLVAGVMPASMRQPDWAQMWTPMAWTNAEKAVRGEHHYGVMARLKPGVDLKQAQAEMNTISSRLEQEYPADDKGWGAILYPLRDAIVSDVRPALLVLLGAVGFVLLIACANVANLVLAKTFGRRKEIAIRAALGATRGRVMSQVLSETVLLAMSGGLLGLLLAHNGVRFITAFLADRLPRSTEVGLNISVLAFTLGVSLLTGILAGLLPAFRLVKTDLNDALKQGLGRTDGDSAGRRTRNILVVSEVALSLLLLIGAGLMVRSLWRLREINPGIDPHGVLTMSLSIPDKKFSTPQEEASFFDQVLQRTRTLPGVESAAVVDALPLSSSGSHQPIMIEGRPPVAMADQPEVDVRLISPGYLQTMRIPLLRGRDFNDGDVAGRPAAILISQSMAKTFWPNEDPIGKRLTLTFSPGQAREIVGIVGDAKIDSLDQSRPLQMLYAPLDQLSIPALGGWSSFGLSLAVRARSNPNELVSPITNVIHQIDRDVPVLDVVTMDEILNTSLSQQRLNMLLLVAFAGLALLLAAVGIYSVLSYSVRRRGREIGVRMALGAQIHDILRMVVYEGMRPTLIGVAIGLGGALALGRVLSSVIYGVSATDPLTFGAVSVLLAGVAFLASFLPALRAARIEPMRALRDE